MGFNIEVKMKNGILVLKFPFLFIEYSVKH